MGVSGSGKSTVATTLAQKFGLKFFEADEFHSPENRAHMAAGRALTDAMREPWIDSLCEALVLESRAGKHSVLAYSGLRRVHRQRFRELGFKTLYLHLQGEKSVIERRIESRQGHYMPGKLLDSQFADMEPPEDEPDMVSLDINAELPLVLEKAIKLAQSVLEGDSHDAGVFAGTTHPD
jgi:gluconokinase